MGRIKEERSNESMKSEDADDACNTIHQKV